MVYHHFCPVPVGLLLPGVMISPIVPNAVGHICDDRIQLWPVAVQFNDVIMSTMASQITSLTMIVCSTVYSGVYKKTQQSFASLASVQGTHRRPVNSPQKGPVTRKMFPLDDVIMIQITISNLSGHHANQYPACSLWNYCSVLWLWALSD